MFLIQLFKLLPIYFNFLLNFIPDLFWFIIIYFRFFRQSKDFTK